MQKKPSLCAKDLSHNSSTLVHYDVFIYFLFTVNLCVHSTFTCISIAQWSFHTDDTPLSPIEWDEEKTLNLHTQQVYPEDI